MIADILLKRVLREWTVYADGSGSYTTTASVHEDFNDRVAQVKQWGPSPGRFEQLNALLQPTESYAKKELPCSTVGTDAPYGEVVWQKRGVTSTLNVQFACLSAEAERVYGSIGEADKLAEQWSTESSATAVPQPASRRVRVGSPSAGGVRPETRPSSRARPSARKRPPKPAAEGGKRPERLTRSPPRHNLAMR